MNKINYIWNEKYRPIKLEDFVGNEDIKLKIKEYINNQQIPHLLLIGKNGTGKSTLAKILINEIKCDYIYINASDENNVETVRNKIKSFASTIGFNNTKIIVLDEFDYVTLSAQAALRNMMEVNSKHTKFILTANFVDKIIEPIISRCQTFEIKPLNKLDIANKIKYILLKENVVFSNKSIATLVNTFYPDIRKMINELQKNVINNVFEINEEKIKSTDYKFKIIEILNSNMSQNDKFNNIRQIVNNNSVSDFSELYKFLYDKIDEIVYKIEDIILILADYEYKTSFVIDKEISFMACIAEILNLNKQK